MKSTFKQVIIFLLTWEAQLVLKKYTPKIIAITGTVGKTSTKDAVHAALSRFVSVRKSNKSFNSEFGVPLTILGQGNPTKVTDVVAWINLLLEGLVLIILPHHYPQWLVLEVGTDRPGDIEALTKWLHPDISIITRLSKVPVHVEAFEHPALVYKEKGNLVRALKPGGTLILNGDDEDVVEYKNETEERVVLYGNSSRKSQFKAKYYKIIYDNKMPGGITFDVSTPEGTFPVELSGTIGRHHMYNVLAAMTVCSVLGESLPLAAKAFHKSETTPGRMRLIEGKNGSVIIDDTYNSSPVALEEALDSLEDIRAKKKIAVLGDMLELGKFSTLEHKKGGERVAKVADILITVGIRARYMAEAALEAGMPQSSIFQFETSFKAGEFLKDKVEEGDVILVKGSQGVRVEKVVEAIMAHPENKKKLLVRQDKEWVERDKRT